MRGMPFRESGNANADSQKTFPTSSTLANRFTCIRLRDLGTPIELVNLFGGKPDYVAALRDLESELYRDAA